MDRIEEMKTFVAIAEEGGFSAAAHRMGLSPPTVTRTVSALEARLGAMLLKRTTRSLSLTEAGSQFLIDVKRILQELEEAQESAAGSSASLRGELFITAPVLFGQMHVMPFLLDYMDAQPDVRAHALFVDRVVNILDEGIDVGIRIGHLESSALKAIPVGQVRRIIVGSPDYAARKGKPTHPNEMLNHRIVMASSAYTSPEWKFQSNGEDIPVRLSPTLFVSSNRAAITAATKAWGLTRILSYQVFDELQDGRLEILLEKFELPPMPIHVVYHESRYRSAKVKTFVDKAVDHLRGMPSLR